MNRRIAKKIALTARFPFTQREARAARLAVGKWAPRSVRMIKLRKIVFPQFTVNPTDYMSEAYAAAKRLFEPQLEELPTPRDMLFPILTISESSAPQEITLPRSYKVNRGLHITQTDASKSTILHVGDESIELLTGESVAVKAVLCEGPVEVGGEPPIAWERYLPLTENV